jgi:hypothetical protein
VDDPWRRHLIDPITIFALCKGAHTAISEGVELYKQLKQDGKDVSGILGEVGSALSKFFTHKDNLIIAEAEAKKAPTKKISIDEESMDRIIRAKQLNEMETQLREMIIYEMDQGGLWSDFTKMREVVRKERLEEEKEKKRMLLPLNINVKSWLKSIKLEPRYALQF